MAPLLGDVSKPVAFAAGFLLFFASAVLAAEDLTPPVVPAPPPAVAAAAPLPDTAEERARILGALYIQLAKAGTAENAKALENAIERLWAFTGSATVDLLLERAAVALAMDDQALSMELLNRCVKMSPGTAEVWNRRASVHFSASRFVEALADLNRALAIDPNHFTALQGAAVTLRELGQKQRALEIMRRYRAVHPFSDDGRRGADELERELEGRRI
jgi:tetratricopeptide (TPR) repeat protein